MPTGGKREKESLTTLITGPGEEKVKKDENHIFLEGEKTSGLKD